MIIPFIWAKPGRKFGTIGVLENIFLRINTYDSMNLFGSFDDVIFSEKNVYIISEAKKFKMQIYVYH